MKRHVQMKKRLQMNNVVRVDIKRALPLLILGVCLIFPAMGMAFPSVYPTGTTVYDPEKSWNGYTMLMSYSGALLIDMNGNEVKKWNDDTSTPNRILPGGYLMKPMKFEAAGKGIGSMVQMDWDGNVVWEFKQFTKVGTEWTAAQHHDWQREGSPTGYYAPGMEPMTDSGKTLILASTTVDNPAINANTLKDDVIYIVSWDGEILWQWNANEHIDEMGFDEEALDALGKKQRQEPFDWLHINCASWVGPNKWYDAGDERFHPENIIWDSRHANILAIIDRDTGEIVWKVGPNYDESPELKELGWIIGVHNTHIIPKGLPGEGNILCFDNGSGAGYGQGGPNSRWQVQRDYSRIIEFNPITLEIVWEYSADALGMEKHDSIRVYSSYESGVQRLPNGSTLITFSATGRAIEVTPELETVWEYVSPHYKLDNNATIPNLKLYRSYRVPYDWVPQLETPREIAVIPPDNSEFRIQNVEGN